MLAAFSPGSDFKRYYRGRMPRLALIVIMLMPLLYGALYLWAFWNPFDAVNKMPVALVNSDTGAEVEGQRLDAGKDVVSGLVESHQLDLHVVSEEEAARGLAHGDYYFTITLPKDFSQSLASPTSGDPRSAQLIFTYNDANNYLATVIGQDAAQLVRSGAMTVPVDYAPGKMFRAEWLAASTQFFGTLLFNVSTTAALTARSVSGQQHLVWNPDAGGSVAFLLSAGFVLLAFVRAGNNFLSARRPDFWAGQINLLGCIAFGVSAVGSFIDRDGNTIDPSLANWGTFIGALCFLVASLIALPQWTWNKTAS